MTIPKEVQHALDKDYKLVPMADITDEARVIAVRWVEGYEPQGMDIPGKQKLASDIMNYARRQLNKEVAKLQELLTYQNLQRLEKLVEEQKQQLSFYKVQHDNIVARYKDELMLLQAKNIALTQQCEFKDEEIKMLKHLRHDSE